MRGYQRQIGIWLMLCCLMVAMMVWIGGMTRLTGSGLSMTDWHPIHGVIPPITSEEWREEFERYRQSPEYRHINAGMSLAEFQGIFWWEYIHRMAGRLVGLVFGLPLLWFALRRIISLRYSIQLFAIFLLGGVQALMGWIMVQSGLNDVPHVSAYKLTAHLSLAFLLFALLQWQAMRWLVGESPGVLSRMRSLTGVLLVCLVVQIMLGGFVAGLDAGLTYNTYPLMDGRWVPAGVWMLEPWWRNLFENVTMVQFLHRWVAMLVAGLAIWLWIARRLRASVNDGLSSFALDGMLVVTVTQVGLGIATLLGAVPIGAASLHQMMALLLFALCLLTLYTDEGRIRN